MRVTKISPIAKVIDKPMMPKGANVKSSNAATSKGSKDGLLKGKPQINVGKKKGY